MQSSKHSLSGCSKNLLSMATALKTTTTTNSPAELNVTLSKIKKNLQGTNSEGEEAGIQINELEHKEEISIQPEQQEETRIQKTTRIV